MRFFLNRVVDSRGFSPYQFLYGMHPSVPAAEGRIDAEPFVDENEVNFGANVFDRIHCIHELRTKSFSIDCAKRIQTAVRKGVAQPRPRKFES